MSVSSSQNVLKVVLLDPHAKLPTKGSEQAAGYDLYAAEDAELPCFSSLPKEVKEENDNGISKATAGPSYCGKIVNIGIALEIPRGYYGRIAPRSGLASKGIHIGGAAGLDIGAGVVDSDYRGCVSVIMYNYNNQNYLVKKGDRIAQLILEKINNDARVVQVESLDDTERQGGGFGSTGR